MGKSTSGLVTLVALLFVSSLGCTSRAASTSTPMPIPPSLQSVASTPFGATDENAAWQKVIGDAKKEGAVTIYSFSFIGDLGNAAKAAFRDRYGINLEFVTGTGSQLVPRIQSEYRAGQYVADILEGADINAIFAKKQGLTQPYGDIPEMRNRDIWVVDPQFDREKHIVSYTYSDYPLWINTKLLSPADAPKSWKALLDPKWKGKIVVTDPDTMPVPGRLYIAFTKYMGFPEDYFSQLGKQDLVMAPNQRENDAIVARGQYPMTITSTEGSIGSFIAEGAPVAPIDMTEGVPTLANPTAALLAKGPHPNASRLFFNWLMSEEGQDVYAKFRSVAPMRKGLTDYRPPQMRVQYAKLLPLGQQDEEDAAQVQLDRVLSKMWKKP